MKNQQIIAHPKTSEEVSALKAFLQALKIKFEVTKEDNYNPEFIEKIKESKEQIAQGKYTEVNQDGLKAYIESL